MRRLEFTQGVAGGESATRFIALFPWFSVSGNSACKIFPQNLGNFGKVPLQGNPNQIDRKILENKCFSSEFVEEYQEKEAETQAANPLQPKILAYSFYITYLAGSPQSGDLLRNH